MRFRRALVNQVRIGVKLRLKRIKLLNQRRPEIIKDLAEILRCPKFVLFYDVPESPGEAVFPCDPGTDG